MRPWRWQLAGGALLLAVACQNRAPSADAPASVTASAVPPSSASKPLPAERVFGAPLSAQAELVDVATVLADPAPYLQRYLKCQGTVARVCQAAGCWLELRGAADGSGLRVPMAGHAFFVPQDIVGQVAVVEGRLSARELAETERAHLTGEGLKATGPLFLEATGVVVR